MTYFPLNNFTYFQINLVPACVAHMNPVELVSEIADKVVLKIVQHVCHEAVDQDLVQRLVQAELVTA
jgi:hypothetical protein